MFDSPPLLPVRARPLVAGPTDPGSPPLDPPAAGPFPAQIASESITRDDGNAPAPAASFPEGLT